MAEVTKEEERFMQKSEGMELVNIPAANKAFILRKKEEARKQAEKDKKE